MLLEALLLLIVLIVTLFYYVNKRPPNFPPVPRISFPILGHFPYFAKYEEIGMYKLFLQWSKECKSSIIGVDFASYKCVVLNDVKSIKQVFSLQQSTGRLQTPAITIRGGNDGIARGLIFSQGRRWTEQRRFSLRHLKEFGFGRKSLEHVILAEAEELVQGLKRDAGKPISTATRFNAAVVNSFWQICSGERFAHDDEGLAKLVAAIIQNIQGSKVIGTLLFMPWFCKVCPKLSGFRTYEENFNIMNDYIVDYVDKRLEKHVPGDQSDFIEVYIDELMTTTNEASSFYKDEGRRNLLNTLGDIFSAGSETTSTTMSWICLYLALDQEIQAKLIEEIDQVIGTERMPNLNDKDKMPFTEAVIQESLRLSSVVALGVFHQAFEDIWLNDVFIPKNTMLIANITGVNHDPEIFGSDSTQFNPGRFMSDDKAIRKLRNESMVAFSSGRRLCIGEALARNELFLFTTAIFQKLTVGIDPNAPQPSTQPNFGGTVAGPLPHKLIFTERQ